jgi:integrase
MSRRGKGPRLWLRRAQYDRAGRLTHAAVWLIKDGQYRKSTGCGADDRRGAEAALAAYISNKHLAEAQAGVRPPAYIPVADVLALYGRDVAPKHSRPRETAQRIAALLGYFGDKVLSDLNGMICRAYVDRRGSIAAARRELEDLRAAINHHRREGLCSAIVEVVLPEPSPARGRWLTREEAARLLWSAWRYREVQKGKPTGRRSRQHIARFILLALYTGTRAGAVCGAALQPTIGRGWIDVARGVFYRRPEGERETKKRKPPIPLPMELHGHLRRWKRRGQRFAVEWLGKPVSSIKKAFRAVAEDAGLGPDVTPHVLRHTAATWLMQAGTNPWEVAGFLGMTVETLMSRYGHHHPDYLSGARGAFSRHRNRHRNTATERERTASNVTKIPEFSVGGR